MQVDPARPRTAAPRDRLAEQESRLRPIRRLGHIQTLRAIAVLGVVIFHFWPNQVAGGFIGVDVFFVISGYLITGGMVKLAVQRRFAFGRFYVRRIRRLIPAAASVTLISGLVAWLVQPVSLWLATFQELLAATLYVQNWQLIINGSDYFFGTPSLAQHYWSLSIEEQFYLIWPVIIVVAVWLGRRAGSTRRGIIIALTAVTLASFVASVLITPTGWQLAYFATYTRAWEFGIGALLALVRVTARGRVHSLAGWMGAVVVGVCMLVYDASLAFPGWIAAIPVLATALCIWAGLGSGERGLSRIALSAPVQWLGDISYSLYLWHWPVIVLAPWILGVEPSNLAKLGLLLLCVALAAVTKIHIEDRFREGSTTVRPQRERRRALVVAFTLPLLVVGLSIGHLVFISSAANRAGTLDQRALAEDLPCYGARALTDPTCTDAPLGDELIPTLATAHARFSRSADNRACLQTVTSAEVIRCQYGDPEADVTVAVVGDSHGLSWLPAVRHAAEKRGWRVVTYLRGACPVSSAITQRDRDFEERLCADWSAAVVDEVAGDPSIDVVMTAAFNNIEWIPSRDRSGFDTAAAGYADVWSTWGAAGKQVVVLEETPLPRDGVLECLSLRPADECGIDEALSWQPGPSPLHAAAAQLESVDQPVSLLRVRDHFCVDGHCPAVAGNVVIYVDGDHVSQAYMRTLAPLVGEGLEAVLADAPR